MALTGIQIFKLLAKSNCGECKFPTCLAFAMALASGKAELDKCPYVSEEVREKLAEASAPPIRPIKFGMKEGVKAIGGETVMFRHEKTFFNPTVIAGLVTTAMADGDVDKRNWKRNRSLIGKSLNKDASRTRCGGPWLV